MTAAPVRSPPACTMRSRPWPASRPSASSPPASRSNSTPSSRSQSMRPGAASVTSAAIAGARGPRRRAGCRPRAAPAGRPRRSPRRCHPARGTRRHRRRARRQTTMQPSSASAVERPGDAAADDDGRRRDDVRGDHGLTASIRVTARRARSAMAAGTFDLVTHVAQRVGDAGERDALHVRAEVAGTDELDVAELGGDVVRHRALGDHHDPRRPVPVDPGDHPGRRADEVGLGQHVRRAFRVRDDANAGVVRAIFAQLRTGEALVHHAAAFPEDDLDAGLRGDPAPEVLVGQEDHALRAERLDDGDRVAGRAADVGLRLDLGGGVHVGDDRHARDSAGAAGARRRPVMDSASEQPARRSGIRTVFAGFTILAVSAMKWTPAMTITSASVFVGHVGEGERVAAQVRDAVEDVGRHVVVREHDGVALRLQRLDLGDERLRSRRFRRPAGRRQGSSRHLTPFMLGVSILYQ